MSEVWTVRRLLEWTVPYFEKQGIDSPRLDAELLLAEVLVCRRIDLYTGYDRPLVAAELTAFKALMQRRAAREPIAYLIGSQGFHQIELKVDKRVLIPRPETELLVEVASKRLSGPVRLLDVGTGSGAIVLSLLYALPEATAIATDISDEALAVAHDNARRLALLDRVQFRHGPFFAPVKGEQFDAIVSNPPYVSTAAVLDSDVVDFEPKQALFSGAEGLDALTTIINQAGPFLTARGWLGVEFGIGQKEALAALAASAGFGHYRFYDDLAGIPRVLEAEQWTR